MKKVFTMFALLSTLYTSTLYAQGSSYELKPANQADVKSIDAIMAALYETISGEAGESRDWNRFLSLWHPDADLIMVTPNNDSSAKQITMTSEEFVKLTSTHSSNNSFYEIETLRKTDQIGHISQVLSTYVIKNNPKDKTFQVRGVNLFQLYFDGKRWWIMNCIWENEVQGMQIPKEYLGK